MLFYASDLSRCVTGTALPVNGGHFFNAYSPDDAEHYLGLMRDQLKAADRLDDPDFEIIIALKARPSNELHDRVASLGVTGLLCAPWMMASSLEDRITAIEGFGSYFCA